MLQVGRVNGWWAGDSVPSRASSNMGQATTQQGAQSRADQTQITSELVAQSTHGIADHGC